MPTGGAMLGAAVIGGISSYAAAEEQSSANEAAIRSQEKAHKEDLAFREEGLNFQKEQYEFQKEQYLKWYNIYGTMQEDLGTYFKNLTGKNLSAKDVAEVQKAQQEVDDRIRVSLAQRGLAGSGLEASLLSQNTYNSEMKKADLRSTAEQRAIAQKEQFLGLGIGQGGAMQQSLNTQSGNMALTYNGMGASSANFGANIAKSQQYAGASSANNIRGFGNYMSQSLAYLGSRNAFGGNAGFNGYAEDMF